jgi:predicted secreted protein
LRASAPKKPVIAGNPAEQEWANQWQAYEKKDLETEMGLVYERETYHRAQKLERKSPGSREWAARHASKVKQGQEQIPLDDKLAAEEAFAANQKAPSVSRAVD